LKKKESEHKEERSYIFDSLMYNSNGGYTTNKAMLLSTVYRCVDVISDSVAQLPLEPYLIDSSGYKSKYVKHPTYYLLNKEPNSKMSRFTFIKTLIVSVLLKGKGYAYIERDKSGNAKSLQYLDSDLVTVVTTDKTNKLMYSITGFNYLVEPINMIHILNFSYDGLNGISTLEHARLTLGLSTDSESHAAGFFKGGANLAGILKV
jgi:HK97 family phage portal protein